MHRTKLLAFLIMIAACGGSQKPAPPPSNGQSTDGAAVAMEPDQIQASGDATAPADTATAPAAPVPGDPRGDDAIKAAVRTIIHKIQYCYEKQLLAKPGLQGTTTAHFTIAPDGTVTGATADGFDPDVDACVAGNFATLKFSPATDGGSLQVNYPFVFNPGP